MILGRNSYTATPLDENNEWKVPVVVGAFTSIARGFKVIGGQHPSVKDRKYISNFPFHELWKISDYIGSDNIGEGKQITIGNDVWIGTDVTIIEGATIGDGAIIGAKAVVAGVIPPYAVAVGNPAIVVRVRFTAKQIRQLLQIKWWEWDNDKLKANMELFKDINLFLEKYGQD